MTPREASFKIVYEVLEKGTPSHIALNEVLSGENFSDKRDRAFATRLVEGTLERLITLDYLINSVSKVKVEKQKPVMRTVLRLGAYQIAYMDSVPDSAACNESVKLLKKKGLTGLSGFANGVLRSITREWQQLMEKAENIPSVKYSCPQWLADYFVGEYGTEKACLIMQGLVRNPDLSIRVNLSKTSVELLKQSISGAGIKVSDGAHHSYALTLSGVDDIKRIPGFEEGLFQVQDESSMFVADKADISPDAFVVDLCAAPGGKSLHAADLINKSGGKGQVLSRDLTESKVRLIEDNIKRNGFTNIRAEVHDALDYDADLYEKADVVICDLPCSGIGIIAKKPDIKYNMTPDKQKELAALQREILKIAVKYVKKGGVLMYSTCTVNKAENEENASFIEKELGLKKNFERQLLPGIDMCDGFFVARFLKE